MRATAITLTMAIGLTLCAQPAFAQKGITPYVGYNYGGDSANCISLTQCEERRTNFGVSIGSTGNTGVEQDIGYAKNFFGEASATDNSVFTLMTNLVIGFPMGPVRVFGLGGLGLIRTHVSLDLSELSKSQHSFAYDYGFGLAISMGGHFGVRGDLRWFNTFEDLDLFGFTGQKLSFARAAVGVTLK